LINNCLNAVEQWLSINKLKLNCHKIQRILFSHKQSTSASIFLRASNNNLLQPLNLVKNLGIILDNSLTMDDQISAVVKTCFFHIRNISKIRKVINAETCKILETSLMFSQLDYCNAL